MKNAQILIFLIGFCLITIATLGIGSSTSGNDMQGSEMSGPESKQIVQQPFVARLKSDNLKHRERAFEAIRKERTELIRQLVELAAEKVEPLPYTDSRFIEYPWRDSKHLAILLLGELRATEGVAVLLDNIEYKNPKSIIVSEYLDKGGWYPAAESLSKIGMPAVEQTIKKLGSYEPKSNGSEICRWILKEILGVRLARLRLQIAIEETRDEVVRKNLSAALPYFKTNKEKAEEERARRQKNKESIRDQPVKK